MGELLSINLTNDFKVMHTTFIRGARLVKPFTIQTQEVSYLISDKLDISIVGRCFSIQPGDGFRIRGEAFKYADPYKEPAVMFFLIAAQFY